jgi:phosphate starvation-inducible protein PhoH
MFSARDVVRHSLVQKVVQAYDRFDLKHGRDHGTRN